MTFSVMILGGYGNFGGFIARQLANDKQIRLTIAGRDLDKAQNFVDQLYAVHTAYAVCVNVNENIDKVLTQYKPDIVINCCGPFQGKDYHVAQCCIEHACHYIDIADGRDFVANCDQLHDKALAANVLVCCGASSVPALSSAVIDAYKDQFRRLEEVEYAISTAQKTPRGLATTKAILSYAGKPFKTLINGKWQDVYGWQDIQIRRFWELGARWLCNCDVPDLELFAKRYPTLKTIRFQAGLELFILHGGLYALSWLVRIGLLSTLKPFSKSLLAMSNIFNIIGTDKSGFYMKLSGSNHQGKPKSLQFNLCAKAGNGHYIPCMPAVILTKKLVQGALEKKGATACMGLITLQEYMASLDELDVSWCVEPL